MIDSYERIMQTSAVSGIVTTTRAWSLSDRWPALAVLAFGLIVLYAVGFSPISFAHNAAHDARHANGFPCH